MEGLGTPRTRGSRQSPEIDRLTREKDAADEMVRRELDANGIYGLMFTLSGVICRFRRITLNEARLCRDALVKEKERHQATI